jgi:hypothetical protein
MAEIAADVTSGGNPGAVEQPDPTKSFDFGNLHEQAMNFNPESTNTPAEAQEQVAGQPQEEVAQNVDNASATQLAQLKDTDLVEVTVDGQPVQMPWGQAKAGVMRQAHYTREMQSLRAREQQFNQERAQQAQLQEQHQAFRTLLTDPGLLRQFAAQKYPELFQAAQEAADLQTQVDPGDIATVGQLQEMQRAAEQRIVNVVEAIEQTLVEREQAIAQNIETRAATLRLANDINHTIKGLFDSHPHIARLIPDAEQVLRYNVSKMQPSKRSRND